MTKEQFQAFLSIIDDYNKQCNRIMKEAEENNTWQMGLDSNKDLFRKAKKEAMDRLAELKSSIQSQ